MRRTKTSLVAAILLAGCGETNIQAIHRLQPAYDQYRDRLTRIVASLPPTGSVTQAIHPARMDPPAAFFEDRTNDPAATAEVLFVGSAPEGDPFASLSIRSPLHFCLEWTGPANPLHPDVWNNRGGLGSECEAALKRPWLVLFRIAESRLPEYLKMEAFVAHAPSGRVVGAMPVEVVGRYGAGDLGRGPWAEEARNKVSSAFHQAASCELSIQLARLPGASFHFDHRPCEGDFRAVATPASLSRALVPRAPRKPEPEPIEPLAPPTSLCGPSPYPSEGKGAYVCSLPELPGQADMDSLRRTTAATIVNLRTLMQSGRSCPGVSDFSALSTLPRLKSLRDVPAECLPRVLATAKLDRLEELDLYCGDGTTVDMRAIAGLPNLRKLNLGLGCGRGPDGLAPLGALANLEELHDISDNLAGIASLHHLRKLSVWTPDLAALAPLTQLEVLWLETSTRDYSALRGLGSLRELTVRTASPGFDPAVLSAMHRLVSLDLMAVPGITDLTPLSGLGSLERLKLDASKVKTLKPLASLASLRELWLFSGCHLASFDFAMLSALPKLESVSLPARLDESKKPQRDLLMRAKPGLRLETEHAPMHCGH
ncbi:MAG: hypothetical protein HY898_16960 [Deltaproteobacteria bacterium]|nr:hypothetical protein [Deltaproteobacteria bacterium]